MENQTRRQRLEARQNLFASKMRALGFKVQIKYPKPECPQWNNGDHVCDEIDEPYPFRCVSPLSNEEMLRIVQDVNRTIPMDDDLPDEVAYMITPRKRKFKIGIKTIQ